ncbi:MAG TPA: lysophospholipid acyltransferase family protein [Actinomycetota bacterium]
MEPVYVMTRIAVVVVLRLFYRFRFTGLRNIPRSGPVIVVPNHTSNFDPLCTAYLVDQAGRRPRFLAKASLWKNRFLRFVLTGARQIPVERGSGDVAPLDAAEAAIARGEAVVIYAEGTVTTNLDLTPMRGKTGAARLALKTGAPVVPAAIWGAQWMLGKKREWRYAGHRLIMGAVGEPMRFDEFEGRQDEPEVRREVTDRIMAEIDRLVRELHKVHPDGGAVPALKDAS